MAHSPPFSSPFSLQGSVALVSGGLGDIGLETARLLLEFGARVALCDLKSSAEAAAQLQRAFPDATERVHYACVDTAREVEVERWIETVTAHWAAPSIAIANAAIVESGSAMSVDAASWQRHLDINLSGSFWLARSAARQMLGARIEGRIVFVGSWAAHAPHPHISAYSVAKAGLRMACQCLALELAPHGITVNEVAPGFVDAGLSARLFEADPPLRERCLERVPSGQILSAGDVAREVLALCDPARRHITGSCIVVDGGLSLLVGNKAQ